MKTNYKSRVAVNSDLRLACRKYISQNWEIMQQEINSTSRIDVVRFAEQQKYYSCHLLFVLHSSSSLVGNIDATYNLGPKRKRFINGGPWPKCWGNPGLGERYDLAGQNSKLGTRSICENWHTSCHVRCCPMRCQGSQVGSRWGFELKTSGITRKFTRVCAGLLKIGTKLMFSPRTWRPFSTKSARTSVA